MSKSTQPGPIRKFIAYFTKFIVNMVIPVALIVAGVYGVKYLFATAPQAERNANGQGEERARLVEVETLREKSAQVTIEAMGEVEPARHAMIQPRVNGEIIEISDSLEPGGYFQAGEKMVRIDPSDYMLQIRQLEADVARAKSDLDLEMGQQSIAEEEYNLLGESIRDSERSLVLREPQLAQAKADIDAAEAALLDAKLDLERTTVMAPFDALVLNEEAELGMQASTSTTIAELVGTDRFWVRLSIPLDELQWIKMPAPDRSGGSQVQVRDSQAWKKNEARYGTITRFTANVDQESRMARVIVTVDDPLSLKEENKDQPPLLINTYVSALIEGKTVDDIIEIDRQYVRENDTVWVMGADDRLEIRDLDILWKGRDVVYADGGVENGERLVTTNLAAPVEGMLLRTNVENVEEIPEESQPALSEASSEENSNVRLAGKEEGAVEG